MAGGGLSYGLNISRKSNGTRPQPAKRKTIFDDEDESEGEGKNAETGIEDIGEFGGISKTSPQPEPVKKLLGSNAQKPKFILGHSKPGLTSSSGDLSQSFTSKKHTKTAEELDPNIYEFDAVYDSFKPQKNPAKDDLDRKPKYMKHLIDAAAIRKRDATIAEEKKLAREREAEGDEYADKEKFVTSAYKKQQEENRRLEEEEKAREADEEKKNKGTGMTNFYKNMLEREERKHAEIIKAAEERLKGAPIVQSTHETKKSDADIAREINAKRSDTIAINDEGQVVDKRQLLTGGLNVIAKPKSAISSSKSQDDRAAFDRSRGAGLAGAGGGKQAMRERQSRAMEVQLEQATKRALEEEEEERQKIERASKSRKTEGDIMSAKDRYLARKREAEEAKK